MPKKILIVYATAGIGHAKAAFASEKAFGELKIRYPGLKGKVEDCEITVIDSLDYTTRFFRSSYQGTYLIMVKHLLLLWGFMYYLTNIRLVDLFVRKARRLTNWMHGRRLVKFLLDTRPDVIISTHFLAAEVISRMKEKGLIDTHLMCVVTDYRMHAFWVASGVDVYIVGSEAARQDLMRWGVEPSRVKVLGIPVGPEFITGSGPNKDVSRRKLGLKEGLFTVLLVGGGFGIGPMEEIVRIISRIKSPLQIAVICGYNKGLLKKIKALKKGSSMNIQEFAFVENMYDFMDAADVLISKSGGITVSEALAKELPMLIASPIIGQESRNCEFLTGRGAAVRIKALSDIAVVLEGLISDPGKFDAIKEKVRLVRRPYASLDIARHALEAK
ncbi:glycosyltransferase [Candidatus Omnitrophota bacterium]